MPSEKHGENDDAQPRHKFDPLTMKYLSKRVGRTVEIYTARAPKALGRLDAVDERFGRAVVTTDEGEEVVVYLSQVGQIRIYPAEADGQQKREGSKA